MIKMGISSVVGHAFGACLIATLCMGAEDWPTYHGAPSLSGNSPTPVTINLSERWRAKTGSRSDWSPVIGSGLILVHSGDATLTALDMTGDRKWSTTLIPEGTNVADAVSAPFVYGDGRFFVAGKSGTIYALSATDGSMTWQHGTSQRIQGSLNISRHGPAGKAVVFAMGQESGRVLAIDLVDGTQVWESADTARCDGHLAVGDSCLAFGSCLAGLHILSSKTGELVKFIEVGKGCEMAGGAVVQGDQVFSGNRSGSVVAASITRGEVLWMNEDGEGEMFTTPAVSSNRVVFSTGSCVIMCLDRANGTKVWEYETTGTDPVSPVIAGDKVVAVSDGTLLLLSLDDGRKLWSQDVGGQLHPPAVVDGNVIVVSDDGYVVMFGEGKDVPGQE